MLSHIVASDGYPHNTSQHAHCDNNPNICLEIQWRMKLGNACCYLVLQLTNGLTLVRTFTMTWNWCSQSMRHMPSTSHACAMNAFRESSERFSSNWASWSRLRWGVRWDADVSNESWPIRRSWAFLHTDRPYLPLFSLQSCFGTGRILHWKSIFYLDGQGSW